MSNRHGGPGLAGVGRTGIQIGPGDAAFLPAGGDVEQSVSVDVRQLDAIGSPRGIIDHVTGPRGCEAIAGRC